MIKNTFNGGRHTVNQDKGGASCQGTLKLSKDDKESLRALAEAEPDGDTQSESGLLRQYFQVMRQYPRKTRLLMGMYPERFIEFAKHLELEMMRFIQEEE